MQVEAHDPVKEDYSAPKKLLVSVEGVAEPLQELHPHFASGKSTDHN